MATYEETRDHTINDIFMANNDFFELGPDLFEVPPERFNFRLKFC
jgi:hypothetical protein